jgi:hypothetical protein
VAIKYAEAMKMASQKNGSALEEMKNTVASPIAKPNSDSCRISFQFIVPPGREL